MSEAVYELFVKPMRATFGPPRGRDRVEFALQLAEALEGFTPRQLESGARWFRDHWKKQTHPSIAECRQVCLGISAKPPDPAGFGRPARAWESDASVLARAKAQDEARVIAAARLRVEPMAEWARDEGWLVGLLEFVTDRRALPDQREIERLRKVSRSVDDNLERPAEPGAGEWGTIHDHLLAMRQAMHERAAAEVFGASPPTGGVGDEQRPLFDDAERAAAEAHLDELRAQGDRLEMSPALRKMMGIRSTDDRER